MSFENTFFQYCFWEQRPRLRAGRLGVSFALLDVGRTDCGPDPPTGRGRGRHSPTTPSLPSQGHCFL